MTVDAGTEEGQAGAEGEETPPEPTMFEQYRARIEAGESVFTPKAEEGEGDAEEEPDPEQDAAAEEGEGEGEGEAAEEEAEAAGEKPVLDEETPGAEEGGEGDEPGEEDLTVTLRGRNPGETFEVTVEDQATADLLRQNAREGLRREELNREMANLQEDKDEIELIDTMMATDPAGFILERVGDDYKLQVARALLLDDTVFEAIQEELGDLTDEKDREHQRLKSEKERRETSDKAKATLETQRAARKAVAAIQTGIQKMLPEGVSKEISIQFQKAGLTAAETACNKLGRLNLSNDELVAALKAEGLLTWLEARTGVSPSQSNGKPEPKAGKTAQEPAAGLKKAKARRRSVAASSPAGVGSPPAAVDLPKNQSVKDRIKHVRSKGLGNVLRGKGRG